MPPDASSMADEAWANAATQAVFAEQQRRSPTGSEDWLALEFAGRHAGELRHDGQMGWLRWDGCRWQQDRTTEVYDLVRGVCREFAPKQDSESSRARKMASAATVAGVERMARSDRRLVASADQWDSDLWTINTPGGLVDLRTGRLRPSDPLAYCTKVAATTPLTEGTSPARWLRFLAEITSNDPALIGFLQCMLGYALTGDTSAHALFFGWGTGANGKSVLVNTVAGILGDYATTAPADVFLASRIERHPTELADLRGARLVVASEIDDGRRWNEARIKSLTGGDRIKARYMRQDFFEYVPQFKLLIVGNHRPSLRGVDEAMRRRLHLLPFTVTIPPESRDPELPEKLKAEWPAIMRWMVDGCRTWQRDGLKAPATVVAATEEYLAAEDSIALWLDEACTIDPNGWAQSSEMFASWKGWTERTGEPTGSQKRFVHTLEARGFAPKRDSRGARGFAGLRLNRWSNDGL
ncbi:hypothetical protein FHP25_13335 [Vineibacter terrae]|uniref:SF3 helicase domain-containing protein n=1 Tax=Vineibacter terrae TaxID=2586908 RepID=A0A5C8PP55_9HYPH|nr:phage/plasmid primase, P4 family [Vineibacter terrae]TXL75632.1 hypothetical protein FHP25_13335 [Vineibacter terrae]